MTEPPIGKLIDNGDWEGVARRLENFDVERAVRRPISDWWLRCAAGDPKSPVELIRTKVTAARADGVSWQRIGDLLCLPETDARQRYGVTDDAS